MLQRVGNGRKQTTSGEKRGEKTDVSMRLLVCGFACCSDTCALGTKNTAAFSQIMGDFAEKQRCFWSALWSAEQNGRRVAEQVGAKDANLGQCGHNM